MTDPRLERWVERLVATRGLTAPTDFESAWRLHVDDSLAALELIDQGPVVDVGSGGGAPGLALAAMLPDVSFVLLESSRWKCDVLRECASAFPNVEVVCARAEEHGRGEGRDFYAVAVARALAPPPVAVEWCLPLVRVGGRLVLFAGDRADRGTSAASALGGSGPTVVDVLGSKGKRLLVYEKVSATPEQFPRRPGQARKRPLT